MVADPYVAAKASLRDNVKTLIAVFGGIAGVLLAGTPYSGYGSLQLFGVRWIVASVALLVSLILLGVAVRKLLIVLRPDLTYASLLTDATTDTEILAVKREFESHKNELLPKVLANDPSSPAMESVAQLIEAKTAAWAQYQEDTTVAEQKDAYDRLADALASINYWSGFTRLHVRVSRGIDAVFWIGLLAILSIAVFALAANSPKPETPIPMVYVVTPAGPVASAVPAGPLPLLLPVLFAPGRSDLTLEAVTRIRVARDYLRTHANSGILVFANTDTTGGRTINETLAEQRGKRVADLLRSEGGVSASRIFVAPLAKSDLPELTSQKTENEANRSVEMILIPLPVRGR